MTPAWRRAGLLASPMFAALHPLLERLECEPTRDDLNALAAARGVVSGGGAPVTFVLPGVVPLGGASYEAQIFRDGTVPTRPGHWHDLFNALAWLAFPRTKAAINRRHYQEIVTRTAETTRGETARGKTRDALTHFDESGLLMLTSEPRLAECLLAFQWKVLFVENREVVTRAARFYLLGHALYEKALAPFKGITATTLVVPVEASLLARPVAEQLAHADALAAEHALSGEALAPLPILGIPGWWPANEDPAYYEDTEQFRSGRRAKPQPEMKTPALQAGVEPPLYSERTLAPGTGPVNA